MATIKKWGLGNTLVWIVIILALCWALFPFYWAIITSFKSPGVILTKPSLVLFLQFKPTLFNWRNEYIARDGRLPAYLSFFSCKPLNCLIPAGP